MPCSYKSLKILMLNKNNLTTVNYSTTPSSNATIWLLLFHFLRCSSPLTTFIFILFGRSFGMVHLQGMMNPSSKWTDLSGSEMSTNTYIYVISLFKLYHNVFILRDNHQIYANTVCNIMLVAAHADLVRIFLRFPTLGLVEAKCLKPPWNLSPAALFFINTECPQSDLHVFNHIGVALEATSHLKWKPLTTLTLWTLLSSEQRHWLLLFWVPVPCKVPTSYSWEKLERKNSFHFRFFNSCRDVLSLNWTFQHDFNRKGLISLRPIPTKQFSIVFVAWKATLRPYLAPVSSKQIIMVGLRLSFTVVILCQGSKGLANPPTKDISTSRVSKNATSKIRVLISRNFDEFWTWPGHTFCCWPYFLRIFLKPSYPFPRMFLGRCWWFWRCWQCWRGRLWREQRRLGGHGRHGGHSGDARLGGRDLSGAKPGPTVEGSWDKLGNYFNWIYILDSI